MAMPTPSETLLQKQLDEAMCQIADLKRRLKMARDEVVLLRTAAGFVETKTAKESS